MDSFNRLAELYGALDPWWMVAVALTLIILDWIYLGTDALMVTGVAIIIMAILNALGLPNGLQLWLCPVALFLAFSMQRKFFNSITSKKSNYTLEEKNYSGAMGIFILREAKNESESYFYEYKKTIHVEEFNVAVAQRICKVKLDGSGEVLPAIDDSESLKNGERVLVIGELNGALLVKKEEI